jgi:hypothetical protein
MWRSDNRPFNCSNVSIEINLAYHVRISILLQEQFQNEDGTLIHYNRYACYAGKPVGSIEYPLKGFIVKEKIGPCDEDLKPMKGKDFKDWSSELGFNIY